MDTGKIQELIAEVKADIEVKEEALKALYKLLAVADDRFATVNKVVMTDSVQTVLFSASDSYIDLAVKIITANDYRPLPMNEIVRRIRQLRGNPNIERRSVEATFHQHIKAKGELSRVVKAAPGIYGVRRFPRQESVA
jgi:hypothetical protein